MTEPFLKAARQACVIALSGLMRVSLEVELMIKGESKMNSKVKKALKCYADGFEHIDNTISYSLPAQKALKIGFLAAFNPVAAPIVGGVCACYIVNLAAAKFVKKIVK